MQPPASFRPLLLRPRPGQRRRERGDHLDSAPRPFLAAAAKFTIYAFNDIGRRFSSGRENPLHQMNVGGERERKSKMRVSPSLPLLLEIAKTLPDRVEPYWRPIFVEFDAELRMPRSRAASPPPLRSCSVTPFTPSALFLSIPNGVPSIHRVRGVVS